MENLYLILVAAAFGVFGVTLFSTAAYANIEKR